MNAGQRYIFKTGKATNFDNSDTELYLFKTDSTGNTGSNSWSNDDINSSNHFSKIDVTIPESGRYILLAKKYTSSNGYSFMDSNRCNIYQVDPQTQVETLICENAKLGGYILPIQQNIENNNTYNSFTTDTSCDIIMCVIGEDNSSSYLNRKIIGYNDDYRGEGDYYWCVASRLEQEYTDSNPRYVFVSLFSNTNPQTVDVYGMCKGKYPKTNQFPNIKEDDLIVSASPSTYYNCIAYSGGITVQWVNPTSHLSPWYNSNTITAFDNFYGNNPPRYSEAMTYTVTSNTDEAVINLYKHNNSFTHASVRKPGNNQLHGYAWESKIGPAERVFHDINSLNNNDSNYEYAYGHIERRYKIANGNSTKGLNSNITCEESLKLGLTKVQNINMNEKEISILSKKVGAISQKEKDLLNNAIYKWKTSVLSDVNLKTVSNSSLFMNTAEYKNLSNLIDTNLNYLYYIIEMFINRSDDVFLNTLLDDKIVSRNTKTINTATSIREEKNSISRASYIRKNVENKSDSATLVTSDCNIDSANNTVYIAPTYRTNALSFIKVLLNDNKILN